MLESSCTPSSCIRIGLVQKAWSRSNSIITYNNREEDPISAKERANEKGEEELDLLYAFFSLFRGIKYLLWLATIAKVCEFFTLFFFNIASHRLKGLGQTPRILSVLLGKLGIGIQRMETSYLEGLPGWDLLLTYLLQLGSQQDPLTITHLGMKT